MEFDLIIACGDSFTEGCKNVLNIPPEKTWPGLVAEKLNIPFMNLAVGGSCNLDISMQPFKNTTPDQLDMIANSTAPLILFNFTVMERFSYPSLRTGYTESCWSVLPEHLEMQNISWAEPVIDQMFGENFLNHGLSNSHLESARTHQSINNPKLQNVDWFIFSTMQAIRMCISWERLIKNSTVRWGFIHINTGNFSKDLTDYNSTSGGKTKLNYPYLDKCYNTHNDMKELQSLLYYNGEHLLDDYVISPDTDLHPNQKGLELISEWFKKYVSEKI